MTSDLTFIPFDQSWARGFGQLLKKLTRVAAPRRPVTEGRQIAARAFLQDGVVREAPELLYSNLLRISSVPTIVRGFRTGRALEAAELTSLAGSWPHYRVRDDLLVSFWPPHSLPHGVHAIPAGVHLWRDVPDIEGTPAEHVVKPLLRKTILCHARSLGLRPTGRADLLFFPAGLLENDTVRFRSYSGRKTRLRVVGERRFRDQPYKYHLAVTFDVRRDLLDSMVVAMRLRVHLTDLSGTELPHATALSRRKHVTRSWWNHQWLARHLAVCAFLSQGLDTISIGPTPHELVLEPRPITYQTAVSLDEAKVPRGQAPYARRRGTEGAKDETRDQ